MLARRWGKRNSYITMGIKMGVAIIEVGQCEVFSNNNKKWKYPMTQLYHTLVHIPGL